MSTSTQAEPPRHTTQDAEPQTHSFDILLYLIVTALAPMFLSATGGEIRFARMAALETVNAYRARTQADLIAVAQIIAFGLGALGSLSLSLTDDLSLSMILRLRGNANSCHRSAEQNRRALRISSSSDAAPDRLDTRDAAETPFSADDLAYEATVLAYLADLQKRIAEGRSSQNAGELAASPAPGPAPPPQQQRQPMRAPETNDRAAERKPASLRAAALSSCASDLIEGVAMSDFRMGQTPPKPSPEHAGTHGNQLRSTIAPDGTSTARE